MKAKRQKASSGSSEPAPGPAAEELPERWSVQRKTELVLRLVRGESLDAVSRESQVPAHELERWQRIFVEQGKRGLRTKAEPEERELILARAKIYFRRRKRHGRGDHGRDARSGHSRIPGWGC
jgi:transposase-like protein